MKKKKEEKEKRLRAAKRRRIAGYSIGYSTNLIKERFLRFMITFDKGEQAGETQSVTEIRPRSYSQENLANEQSLMIESRSVASHGYALSQYVCQQSAFNDETESEHDEEEEEHLASRKKTIAVLSEIKPTLTLFQKYIKWFQSNEVTTIQKYEEEQQALKE